MLDVAVVVAVAVQVAVAVAGVVADVVAVAIVATAERRPCRDGRNRNALSDVKL